MPHGEREERSFSQGTNNPGEEITRKIKQQYESLPVFQHNTGDSFRNQCMTD